MVSTAGLSSSLFILMMTSWVEVVDVGNKADQVVFPLTVTVLVCEKT